MTTYDACANRISGWMSPDELMFLFELSVKYHTIAEVGSWKGRSTHALLSGGASVTAVDTWLGSSDPNDTTNALGVKEDVYAAFCENTKQFTNLTVVRKSSLAAAVDYADKAFDVVFIDANHEHDNVVADIQAWMPKATHILCGHDYGGGWDTVTSAVNDVFGKPHGVVDSIWWVCTDDGHRGMNLNDWENRIRLHGVRAVRGESTGGLSDAELVAADTREWEQYKVILQSLRIASDRFALDFGCGPGRFTEHLTELFPLVMGVDPFEYFLAQAPHSPNIQYRHMSSSRIPADDESIDVVWCRVVLSQLPDFTNDVLQEFNRVLAPGGLMFLLEDIHPHILTANFPFPLTRLDSEPDRLVLYGRKPVFSA